ncbi:MAG: DNA-binding protein [Clostridia bacterium]|nr:DNA-binding protein [Clostridia bacterium]
MRSLYLGLDTSNYKTSAGLYCPEDGSFRACGKLLEVPQGTLGLRQSDALFQHVKQLPEQVKSACRELDGQIRAIGFSSRPRDLEDSYMPCFLAGQCVAQCLGAAMDVPVYDFSHQQGHLAAAAFSVGKPELMKAPFLAWHLSGGTTELLLVEPSEDRIIRADILGGTTDISAGQVIDRVGVDLDMRFPAGPYVEQAALQSQKDDFFRVKVQGCNFSLSGVQNQYLAKLKAGESREDVCRFVLLTVAQAILKATRNARKERKLPVLISGGVSVCSLVQEVFANEQDVWFALKGLGGDNAVGTAILTSMR